MKRQGSSRTPRARRNVRAHGKRIVFTERDEVLVSSVARFGLVRSGDLKRLLFPDRHRDVLATRLRKLFDAGYLDVHVSGLDRENAYSLGPKGKAWARERTASVVRPPKGNVEHWLGIVSTWTLLSRHCHDTPGWALHLARPEWELRPALGGAASSIIPDLVVEVSAPESGGEARMLRCAIEVDRGSEGALVLSRKVTAYGRLLAGSDGLFGWSEFGLGFALSGWKESGRSQRFLTRLKDLPTWSLVWDLDDGPGPALTGLVTGQVGTVAECRHGNGTPTGASDCVFNGKQHE